MAGYEMEKEQVLKRLARIEGQVRGISRMVDDDRYCIDVLDQVSAVNRALQNVAIGLVREHLAHCVVDAVAQGGAEVEAKVDEATKAIARLART